MFLLHIVWCWKVCESEGRISIITISLEKHRYSTKIGYSNNHYFSKCIVNVTFKGFSMHYFELEFETKWNSSFQSFCVSIKSNYKIFDPFWSKLKTITFKHISFQHKILFSVRSVVARESSTGRFGADSFSLSAKPSTNQNESARSVSLSVSHLTGQVSVAKCGQSEK